MCGISGVFNFNKSNIESEKIIRKIVKLQHQRGPDENDIWISDCKRLVFGHNRLSIIDLSIKAKQPFSCVNNNCVITFNGEIYNYKEIRKDLESKNIKFKSNSDTEVIIESYKYWGEKFIEKLRGMFSFAIWDNKKKKLLLARDPFGIKPLYYLKINGSYIFASQIKSLLSIDNIKFEYSDPSIVSYYLWGNIQEPFTLYKNIFSLNKGTYLTVESNGKEKSVNYANIKNLILNTDPINFSSENERNDYLRNYVNETVNYHQVSDVPRTILLSSGIDSNVILSSISNENKKNCSALTLDFDYKNDQNETILAKQSALINEINHNISKISDDDFYNLLENFYKDMDSPTNDGFNNYLISHVSKKMGSKIIISGIGGDEIFSGYPTFKLIPKINRNLKYLPKIKFLNQFIKNKIYKILKKFNLKTKYAGIEEFGRSPDKAFLLVRSLFLPFELEELVSDNSFKKGFQELNILNELNDDISGLNDTNLSTMYLEIKYFLCSKLLRDCDWVSMAHSVELRTPFVDWFFFKKMIALIKSDIPPKKKSLYQCYKNNLPKDLIRRKKTGFMIPHENFLKKLSIKKQYPNALRDWSILSFKKYRENEKNT